MNCTVCPRRPIPPHPSPPSPPVVATRVHPLGCVVSVWHVCVGFARPVDKCLSAMPAVRKYRRDTSEVSCCLKYVIFGFNVMFWVSTARRAAEAMLHDGSSPVRFRTLPSKLFGRCPDDARCSKNNFKCHSKELSPMFLLPDKIYLC